MWSDYAGFLANELFARYGTKAVISDEKFNLLPDGNGEIYVIEGGRVRHKMSVPKSEFKIVE